LTGPYRDPKDPRKTALYRANARLVLGVSDICHLCGHAGAMTVDHIVSVADWRAMFGSWQGVNDLSNLAPAHGNRGHLGENRCSTCNQLCNQSRGRQSLAPQRRSQPWG
jgi:5-methylcytosine-specific restriction endonuclease McrA